MTRILVELIPSAFIHSTLRKKHNKDKVKYESIHFENLDFDKNHMLYIFPYFCIRLTSFNKNFSPL